MSRPLPLQQSLFSPRSAPDKVVVGKGIERQFDVPFVAELALREKQVQQNYRPIIAVHKWFARRPGTLFRALLLAEFVQGSVRDSYFQAHDLQGTRIADPFMGGGTPLIEANRLGCDIIGYDINPMAYWIVRQEIEHLDLEAYHKAALELLRWLEGRVGESYRTKCLVCGREDASVKYFLWVKVFKCIQCGKKLDLFPGYLLAENRRHPKNVIVCHQCGELNEVGNRKRPGDCRNCASALTLEGPARQNRCSCSHCGNLNIYPQAAHGVPTHRMFAIEYHCSHCKPDHQGRFFKKPDRDDLANYARCAEKWRRTRATFVPTDEIPSGDETARLHRWGYKHYHEMFNERQLLGLELICRAIARQSDERVRNALATNLSDLLRYQNMLCRYDTYALKSLDIFSIHGFPVGLVECESNLLGISNGKEGLNVGSGGWSNIVEKFLRGKQYCENPFEIVYEGGRKCQIPIAGEWIGDKREASRPRQVLLKCDSSTNVALRRSSLDAVITDPPYFANVQYAELMDFCFVWLRRLVRTEEGSFKRLTTRNPDELTGNATMERGLDHFTQGLSSVFSRMAEALKPGAPLAFTYHHNSIEAYYPPAVAILDAGLVCSASLPCPAEMGASIHINRTGSSIVDTIFVCRSIGRVPRRSLVATAEGIAELVSEDLGRLRDGGMNPTRGDARCVAFGHMIRLAIWNLREAWPRGASIGDKIRLVADIIEHLGGVKRMEELLPNDLSRLAGVGHSYVREPELIYGADADEIPF
jgi:putative DNA methylase